MSNRELISVIIPIYNVEQYLSKCINSIINQTYKNIEIVLIDDGSSDNSPAICDEYKKLDSRVIVIHKKNAGLSSARNKGLDIVKGNYICFVDSDDYIEANMIEELKNNMEKFNSDISVCNFYDIKNSTKKVRLDKDFEYEFVSIGKEKFINIQNEYSPLTYYAWNKLYKKEVFDSIKFPEGRLFEYTYIFCDVFNNAERISFTLKPLYNYVYRNNSLGNKFNVKHFDKIGSFDKKIEFFNKNGYYNLSQEEQKRKALAIISNLIQMKMQKNNNNKIYKKYRKELAKTLKKIKWKGANKRIKLYKVLRENYINLAVIKFKYNLTSKKKEDNKK